MRNDSYLRLHCAHAGRSGLIGSGAGTGAGLGGAATFVKALLRAERSGRLLTTRHPGLAGAKSSGGGGDEDGPGSEGGRTFGCRK